MGRYPQSDWETDSRDTQLFCDYISMIVRKLKPGGLASIVPVRGNYQNLILDKDFEETFGVEISFKKNFLNDIVLQMRKSEKLA